MMELEKHLIFAKTGILEAMERLNRIPLSLTMFVIDNEQRLVGTLTDGDIRRGFLKGNSLRDEVEKFMTRSFSFLNTTELLPSQIKQIKSRGVKLLPVLDGDHKIVRVIDFSKVTTILPVDAVLMAGGRGERLCHALLAKRALAQDLLGRGFGGSGWRGFNLSVVLRHLIVFFIKYRRTDLDVFTLFADDVNQVGA